MKSLKKTAKLVGALFLIAMVTSLLGGGLIETVQQQSDNPLLVAGVLLEVINALSVLGIGILLYPVLKSFHSGAAKAYLGLRILESLACLAAPLILIFWTNRSDLRVIFTSSVIPLFFCCGALVLYSVLSKYRLLPRFISIWGFIGVAGIVALNTFKIQSSLGMILALPIILNEIFMGIWLIVKGFNTEIFNLKK